MVSRLNCTKLAARFAMVAFIAAPQLAEAKKTQPPKQSPKVIGTQLSPDEIKGLKERTANCGDAMKSSPQIAKSWPQAVLSVKFIADEKAPAGYRMENISAPINPDAKVPLASITKNMTALLIFDAIKKGRMALDDKIAIKNNMFCLPDNTYAAKPLLFADKITVKEALILLLRQSNNIAGRALAEAEAGSEDAFVVKMNEKAKSWGLSNTQFTSPHGMPPKDRTQEFTTALDQAKMVMHMLPYFNDYKEYSYAPLTVAGQEKAEHTSAAKEMLRKFGAIFKTGTSAACDSLVSVFEHSASASFLASISLCAPNSNKRFTPAMDLIKKIRGMSQKDPTAVQVSSAMLLGEPPIQATHPAPSLVE